MNKVRRKSIQDIADQLEEVKSALEDIQGEEEACRDSIPENLQGSAQYEASDAACEALSAAVDNLEDIISSLSELTDG